MTRLMIPRDEAGMSKTVSKVKVVMTEAIHDHGQCYCNNLRNMGRDEPNTGGWIWIYRKQLGPILQMS